MLLMHERGKMQAQPQLSGPSYFPVKITLTGLTNAFFILLFLRAF
jgi:hypothetical protein